MRHTAFLGLLLPLAAGLGCVSTSAAVRGIIVEAPSGDYKMCELDRVRVGLDTLEEELSPNKILHTRDHVKIDIARSNRGLYSAVFGPHPNDPDQLASGHIENPLYISSGYAFVWGRWPVIRTSWVNAVTEGTTFVVEVDGAHQRVYFLRRDPQKVEITCGSATPVLLDQQCTFVEFDSSCNPTLLGDVHNNADAVSFVTWVKRIALAAGWDEEGSIDCTVP